VERGPAPVAAEQPADKGGGGRCGVASVSAIGRVERVRGNDQGQPWERGHNEVANGRSRPTAGSRRALKGPGEEPPPFDAETVG